MNIETHPLTPFLPQNARFLLLGSFPPPKQRWKMDFYYPNYNNDMWRIMGLIFYGDKDYFIDIQNKKFKQYEIQQFLQQQGIAISDTVYQAIRLKDNASDQFLQVVQEQDIAQLLAQLPNCQHILTTGEKATKTLLYHYGQHGENKDVILPKIGQFVDVLINHKTIKLHRLPSSSRAYPLALEQKASYYQAVLKL
ncbi:uracil-DNA glycosylase family protein [Moraxella sp. ZY210820]|uniref:uracil-DNA glycosylase family protein n=1 Tax=unclassified Moraxella TaxID=2685852 RepID=UPI00272F282B|nr:uracil-DNA glycosylase family protein [Moraxella sp. ZY210820]WLF83737.1 uracil-DNA glycosylase family protein [Moraxella sp. ZY210820]